MKNTHGIKALFGGVLFVPMLTSTSLAVCNLQKGVYVDPTLVTAIATATIYAASILFKSLPDYLMNLGNRDSTENDTAEQNAVILPT